MLVPIILFVQYGCGLHSCAPKSSGCQRRWLISLYLLYACHIFGRSHLKCINVKSRIPTNFILNHFHNNLIPPVILGFLTGFSDPSTNTHYLLHLSYRQQALPSLKQKLVENQASFTDRAKASPIPYCPASKATVF